MYKLETIDVCMDNMWIGDLFLNKAGFFFLK